MGWKTKNLVLFVFSLALLGATLFVQVPSHNAEELKKINFGYPLAFISQNHSSYYSFLYFPTWDKFNFRDVKNINGFSPLNLAASLVLIFIALEIAIWFLETLDFWVRRKIFGGEDKTGDNILE
ncbi:MAG: hypothetical protein P4L62_01565 [Candidatus Pacebacteria bacterium]|nr:hypothetical protein [Candidatus Paceibacterota bacterium]